MPRLAYVVATFPTLTETFVLGEILELRRRGWPITIFALRRSRGPVQQPEARLLERGVQYPAPLGSTRLWRAHVRRAGRQPGRYLRTLADLVGATWRNPIHLGKTLYLFVRAVEFAERMETEEVGHVHAHWAIYPTTVALAVSGLTGLPFSFTAHAWDVNLIRTLLPEKIRRARFVVTCTAENQAALGRLAPDGAASKVHLNHHGIDLERFEYVHRESRPGTPTILACGSLLERKGFADLVQACGLLKRQGRVFACVIVGTGPQRSRLEALIAAQGVEHEVVLAGALGQAELVPLYARSCVFVLPCLVRPLRFLDREADPLKALEVWFERGGGVVKDGIPNVLVEALATGLPVVSTPTSGIPELVRHEWNGLLVPPQDPVRLAEAIDRLLGDPGLRQRLGGNGAADVRARFDRRRNVERLAKVFHAHLGDAAAPAPAGLAPGCAVGRLA